MLLRRARSEHGMAGGRGVRTKGTKSSSARRRREESTCFKRRSPGGPSSASARTHDSAWHVHRSHNSSSHLRDSPSFVSFVPCVPQSHFFAYLPEQKGCATQAAPLPAFYFYFAFPASVPVPQPEPGRGRRRHHDYGLEERALHCGGAGATGNLVFARRILCPRWMSRSLAR